MWELPSNIWKYLMIGNRLFKANTIASRFRKRNSWWSWPGKEGKLRKTRCVCSCWMCRNPRALFGNGHQGKPFQEVKQNITYKEELNEL